MEIESPGPAEYTNAKVPGDCVVAHLDKSHITVHTYPESHPDRVSVAFELTLMFPTCGEISPLRALNFLLHSFEADIVNVDYRVVALLVTG